MKGAFLLAGVVMLAAVAALIAAEPSWWAGAGIGNGEAANHAPANLGQAKFMAKMAREHLNFTLDDFGGAGPGIDALVDGFASGPENYSPILAGQLKYVAKPFYDRLMAVGFDTRRSLQEHGALEGGFAWPHNFPWNPATPTSENYSPVLLGQLKLVFSFDLNVNIDTDALPDWWEWGIINASQADGDPNNNLVAPAGVLATGDFDGDGLDNAREFALHTDATDRSSGPEAVLLGRWDFDERSGAVAADGSGHNHPAALTQTYYWRTEPGARSFLRLPDAGGFAQINAPDLLPGANDGDFSVAFWIRLQEAATGNWRVIMQKGDSLWERTFAMWLMPGNNRIYYRISGAANPDMGSQSVSELEVGEWAHVAYVKEGRTLRLYLNGVEDSNVALPEGSVANDGPIYIGKDPWYDAARADFDDLQIYNVALRPGEVASLLTGGKWDSDHDGLSDHQEQALGTDPRSGDTDFDGVSDAREGADGTDPLDPVSVTPRRIAHFAFDEADWRSAEGQMPVESTGVARVSDGLLYDAMRIDDTGQVMRYDWQRAGDGAPNVSLRRGTIRLWFKPDWSGSTMTGTWSRLLELGRYRGELDRAFFALHLAPNQPTITLATHDGAGHAAYSVFPFSAAAVPADQWHQVVVTYSPTQRAVWLDGLLLGTQAAAWPYAPRAADLIEDGLRVGNDWYVSQPIKGAIDEVECFNYELSAATIAADYAAQSYWLIDSDTDGYRDWWEIAEHGGIANFPPPGGLPSGWSGLDPDLDGISNGDEARRGTRTNKKDSDEDGIPDADERSAGTDPNDSDEDGNGSPDGADDWDEDALSNAIEAEIGTRFRVPVADADTDGDGLLDGEEAVPIPGGEDMQVAAAPDTRYALIEIGSVEDYGTPVGINDAGKVLLVKEEEDGAHGSVWENGQITQLGVAEKFIGPLNDEAGTIYKLAIEKGGDRESGNYYDFGVYSDEAKVIAEGEESRLNTQTGSMPSMPSLTKESYLPSTLTDRYSDPAWPAGSEEGWDCAAGKWSSITLGSVNDNHVFLYAASLHGGYSGNHVFPPESLPPIYRETRNWGTLSVTGEAREYGYTDRLVTHSNGYQIEHRGEWYALEINNQGVMLAYSADYYSAEGPGPYLFESSGATPREIPNADDVTGLTDSDLGKGEGPYFVSKRTPPGSSNAEYKLTCYNKGSFKSIDKNIKTLPGDINSDSAVSGRAISKNLVMAMGEKIWKNCRLLDLATLCGNPVGWSDYIPYAQAPGGALATLTANVDGADKDAIRADIEIAPDVLKVNSDFDEQKIDTSTTYAKPDNADDDLKAERGDDAGKIIVDDLHKGFWGINPSAVLPKFFTGATVTITKKPETDSETGQPETGTIRLYAIKNLGAADEQSWAIPISEGTEPTISSDNPANLATTLYSASSTVPKGEGVTYYIEGVTPGPITMEFKYVKGNLTFTYEQNFEVYTKQSKRDWQEEIRQQVLLETSNAVDLKSYRVVSSFMTNRQYLQRIYFYYEELFRQRPTVFYWAGLAKLAGGPVYAALSDAEWGRTVPPPWIPGSLALYSTLGSATINSAMDLLQSILMSGNKDIYDDLGWQFRAYHASGIWALRYVSDKKLDAPSIVAFNIEPWNQIYMGDATSNATLIKAGNLELTRREQRDIVQPDWSMLGGIDPRINLALSILAKNPLSGGPDFLTVVPGGDITVFEPHARWAWIEGGSNTIWTMWTGYSDSGRMARVLTNLKYRAEEYSWYYWWDGTTYPVKW